MDVILNPCRMAVIMARRTLNNRWASEQWEAKGAVLDEAAPGDALVPGGQLMVTHANGEDYLFRGLAVKLEREEAVGYYLNLTSDAPKLFVLWRMRDARATPEHVTVSYNEGTRWADGGEQVDGVPLPLELTPWMADFVERHYKPEPKKAGRYASNKDRTRSGRE
ncbi:MAG: DUF3305 domain-containing protein [Burkholderiales bacterium]